MKVTFTCKSEEDADKVYELLTNPLCGCECLSGSKACTNYYQDLPDVWEFDLNQKELEKVLELPEVSYGGPVGLGKIGPASFIKTGQTGIPKLASYTTTFSNGNTVNSCIPHSILYCQDYNLSFTHDPLTNGSIIQSLSSIDCSNVDIIVIDGGVDGTHDDFKDELGNSRVVNFNWTLLRDPSNVQSGPQIISQLPAEWTSDKNGHGTACASLVAGNRCGFAKKAKIYFIKASGLDSTNQGVSIEIALKLALSFQKSKKLNLYGLDSTRPTICTNSWGYFGPNLLYAIENNNDTRNFSTSFYIGKRTFSSVYSENIPYFDSVSDSYFRQMLDEGTHVLRAAGNHGAYLKNDPTTTLNAHFFRRNFGSGDMWFVIPRTQTNNSSYQLNVSYGGGYIYGFSGFTTGTIPITYGSPSIGINTSTPLSYTKEQYPLIIVGDIIPVGYNDEDENIYWSAGTAKAVYTALSANNITGYIRDNIHSRYPTLSGPFFVKSVYSNFGPDVDVYAPGNGAWAALSNQITSTVVAPQFTITQTGKYFFFNGTSSACPIAAGVLGTYLAEFPNATNKDARLWLLQNSVSGNIMETQKNTLPVNSFDGVTNTVLNIPFGSDYDNMNNLGYLRLQKGDSTFRKGNIYDVAFNTRFFDSANLIVQAYPLRKAIVKNGSPSINFGGTTLLNIGGTRSEITHSIAIIPPTQAQAYELVEPDFVIPEISEGIRLV